MSGPGRHMAQVDAAFEGLTPEEREFEKKWPGTPGLTMEKVVQRLDRYKGKGKIVIPTKRDHSAQEWREEIVNTARIAQQHIVKEKVKRRIMPPPNRPAPPPAIPEEGEVQSQPPRPWGNRTHAHDRHSATQVMQDIGGLLNPGGGRRRKPPDRSHSNQRMAELQSASESEAGNESPLLHAGIMYGGDPHARTEQIDLTQSTDDEGGAPAGMAGPAEHYRQGKDDYPQPSEQHDKYAQSLGFKNTIEWSQAWAAVHGEENTEEMHRMVKSAPVTRTRAADKGDDMMARTYGYKNYGDMMARIPHMKPEMTGVTWNSRIHQMRKHFRTEIEKKSPKGYLGGWTIEEAAKAMGAKGAKHFHTNPEADKILKEWGKKHKRLRGHHKDTGGTMDADYVSQIMGFNDWNAMRTRMLAKGQNPNDEIKKIQQTYLVTKDAPKRKPDERTLQPLRSVYKEFSHPAYQRKLPSRSPELEPFRLGHSVARVVQNHDDAKEEPAGAASASSDDVRDTLEANGQRVRVNPAAPVTPVRTSHVGARRQPARAATAATTTYQSRTPEVLMPLDDPRRGTATPPAQRLQTEAKRILAEIAKMNTKEVKHYMRSKNIPFARNLSVDRLREQASRETAEQMKRAKLFQQPDRYASPRGSRSFQSQWGNMPTGDTPDLRPRKRRRSPLRNSRHRRSHSVGRPGYGRRRRPSPSPDRYELMSVMSDPDVWGDPSGSEPEEKQAEVDPRTRRRRGGPITPAGTPIAAVRARGRQLHAIAQPHIQAPARVAGPRVASRLLHRPGRYHRHGVTRPKAPRNIVSPFRMNYESRGGHGWNPTPKLSVNQIDSGRFLIRARRGVTKGIRHQVMHLLQRVRGKVKINGRLHTKKQAREVIIDLLAQNITVDVEIAA